jgi:putative FmdB family regulatory protein
VPIYEFVCKSCGRLTEVMQRLNDPPPAACPECGAGPLARMVSRTSFQLKGGGWYSDLYGSPKEKPKPPATSAPGGETKAGGEAAKKDGGAAPAAAPAASPPAPASGGAKPTGAA